MKKQIRLIGIGFIFLLILLNSCSKKQDDLVPENKYLISAVKVNEFTRDEIKTKIQSSFNGIGTQAAIFLRSGIRQIKISYKTTDYEGKAITASGAFFYPQDLSSETLSLACIQHGTLFNKAQAPSFFGESTDASLGTFIASTGFIVGLPDYIGYGDSESSLHPYEHNKSNTKACLDFYRAIYEYIKIENLKWNSKLLIAGYSQGGFTTLSIQKEIEEKFSKEFNLVASSCGSGAYNKTATVKDFIQNKTSGEATNNKSYIWVLLTYDKIYGFNRPKTDYFIEPFASQIAKDGYQVTINKSFDEILNPSFKKGILDGTETNWIKALQDNDVFDWKPSVPTRLYHGTADTYVPYLNSSTAEAAMKKRGSTSVELIPIDKGTHSSAIGNYFLGTFEMFNKYK